MEGENKTIVVLEPSKTGRATCKDKDCKQLIAKDTVRVSKSFPMAVLGEHLAVQHFHPRCFFVSMMPRARNWRFTSGSEIEGYDSLSPEQRAEIDGYIAEATELIASGAGKKRKAKKDEEGEEGKEEKEEKKADKKDTGVTKPPKAKRSRKSKKDEEDDEDADADFDGEEEEEEKPKKKARAPSKKKAAPAAAGAGVSADEAKAQWELPPGWDAQDQVVLFTGFRDADLQKAIEASGGNIAASMTSKVTLVVAADSSVETKKVEEARKKGVLVCDAASLRSTLGL